MLILPERNLPKGRILLPQRPQEWRQPSQRPTTFGIENKTRFCLTGRIDDGHIVWRGWFDDREDADAFLYSLISGSLQYERDLWRLPIPWWDESFIDLVYDFVTTRTLTSTSGSNQTDVIPTDWNSASNTIEVIASGGSGGGSSGGAADGGTATGGGGGAYSKKNNLTLTPGGTATFHLETGAAANNYTGTSGAGNVGGDAWYNGATLAGSSVGAKGGGAGNGADLTNPSSGAAGGAAGSGVGDTKNSGGNSGDASGAGNQNQASGGGGAAGPNGNGSASAAVATDDTATAGGSGDAGSGGSGGTAGSNNDGGVGGSGVEFGVTGSGGGGGGAYKNTGASVSGGTGGFYGAGGGGASCSRPGTSVTGAGRQGIIFITYAAVPFTSSFTEFSQPHKLRSRTKMVSY